MKRATEQNPWSSSDSDSEMKYLKKAKQLLEPPPEPPTPEISERNRGPRECFVCRVCKREIATTDDLLTRLELHLSCGIFRAVRNVVNDVNLGSDPGCANFYSQAHCSHCFTLLGAGLVYVPAPEFHQYGVHWEAENYLMIMSTLQIRRGNMLLDAVTREVVEGMNPYA